MSAFIVADVEVTDPKAYELYRAETPGVLAKYGGSFLIRGPEPEVLEGEWRIPRLVVLKFPDAEAARRFYYSEDYQKIIPLRRKASRGSLAIVEGFD